jgi:hypothetical protein
MKVTVAHLRTIPGFGPRPGFCARGARAWFTRHGLSYGAFVRDGIDADTLLATGDAFALAIVEHAKGGQHGRGK